MNRFVFISGGFMLPVLIILLASCSFDYGNQEAPSNDLPDIVMSDVDYVRIRSGDPTARFQAERAERFEQQQKMQLWNFSFEQLGNRGEDVNASGKAGSGSIEIDTGDVVMDDGVRIEVDSEDIAIETKRLEWKDKARTLSGNTDEKVLVMQPDGTSFTGIGFHADARSRTWEFGGFVSGTYIHEDKKEDAGANDQVDSSATKDSPDEGEL